jgi:glutamyl-tRNA reductase
MITMTPPATAEAERGQQPLPAGETVRVEPMAMVVALIAHARGVPSAEREAFAAACAALGEHEGLLLVHTCHRVELYVAPGAMGGRALPVLPAGGQRLTDADAAGHLISVAAGLQSAVLGEDQVLHQVRQAYTARRAAGPLDPVLDRLFQLALQAGRRAHGWFAGSHRSLGDAALDEIERCAGPLTGRPILIVGAGSMGRLAAQAAARRGARPIITNRTPERASALARQLGAQAAAYTPDGTLGSATSPAGAPIAGAVIAQSGPWAPLPGDAAHVLASGATVVDLSSPPAVPADLQTRLAGRFVSIDDLAWGPQIQLPGALRGRLQTLVTDTTAEYRRWLAARDSLPAIAAITQNAETRRTNELAWLARRTPGLSEHDRALIDQMTHRLVAAILHAPRTALHNDQSGDLGRAAWELFDL